MPQKVARRLKKIRRAKSYFLFFISSIFSKTASKTGLAAECRPLLEGGVPRCGFEGALPGNSFTLQLTRGDRNLYSLDLALP